MQIIFIVGGLVIVGLLLWVMFRESQDNPLETKKTVLSSDLYTKAVLAIIALATSIIALQGFINWLGHNLWSWTVKLYS